jgi:hypothetical protein
MIAALLLSLAAAHIRRAAVCDPGCGGGCRSGKPVSRGCRGLRVREEHEGWDHVQQARESCNPASPGDDDDVVGVDVDGRLEVHVDFIHGVGKGDVLPHLVAVSKGHRVTATHTAKGQA